MSCDEFLGLIFAIDELSKLSDIKVSNDGLISGSGQLLAMLSSSQKTMLSEVGKDFAETLEALVTAAKTNSEMPLPSATRRIIADSTVAAAFREIFGTVARRLPLSKQPDVLLKSLLTTLISGFEVHMNRLIRFLLTVNPVLIEDSNYALTLREIMSFESIGDVQLELIERKTKSLIADGIDTWVRRFEKNDVRLNLKDMVSDWVSLREVFARRNAIVHNDGLSDRRYELALTSNGASSSDIPTRDSTLPVSRDYLHNSLQVVAGFAVNLTASICARFAPQHIDDACMWVVAKQEDLLHCGLWEAVVAVSSSFPQVQNCARSSRVSLRTNRWIAMSELGQRDQLAEEVKGWDSSGLDLWFSHMKAIFLEDHKTSLTDIRTLLETNKITAVTILSHPLYRQLRVSGQLDDILSPRASETEPAAPLDDEMPDIPNPAT
jgi:hypothetical protein